MSRRERHPSLPLHRRRVLSRPTRRPVAAEMDRSSRDLWFDLQEEWEEGLVSRSDLERARRNEAEGLCCCCCCCCLPKPRGRGGLLVCFGDGASLSSRKSSEPGKRNVSLSQEIATSCTPTAPPRPAGTRRGPGVYLHVLRCSNPTQEGGGDAVPDFCSPPARPRINQQQSAEYRFSSVSYLF